MANKTSYNYYAIGDDNADGNYFHGNFVLPQDGVGTQIFAGGTSAAPLTTAVAANSLMKFYCTSTDTGDDNRFFYAWYNASGVGGGFECFRGRTVGTVAGLNDIRGGNFTAALNGTATSQVTGMGCGVQATFEALAATRVMTGTIASLVCTSFIATGNTVPATAAFIRCTDEGSVAFNNLFNLATVSTGAKSNTTLLSTGLGVSSGLAINTAIKITANGVTYWIAASTTQPSATS